MFINNKRIKRHRATKKKCIEIDERTKISQAHFYFSCAEVDEFNVKTTKQNTVWQS